MSSPLYAFGEQHIPSGAPGFADRLAHAHSSHHRPRCLCQTAGVEMYVARLPGDAQRHVLKRMPDTGHLHATDCPSYEPPADASGLGQLLGSAITEDPNTGQTLLKLDFALSKVPGRSNTPPATSESDHVKSDGTRLSLRGLMHYLWDQAGLTRWHPGFAGKRTWATVRRHLLAAAAPLVARGDMLLNRLYLPEPFSVEQRDAINQRRLARWTQALAQPGKASPLMLLLGEVKEIVPSRYGYRAVIKHMPDQAFAIDERLYHRLERRFATELELWGADDAVRLAIIATFGVTNAGLPCIDALSLMALTHEWIPISNRYEGHLVSALVNGQRSFVKTLAYNLRCDAGMPSAVLTDTGGEVVEMFIQLNRDSASQWHATEVTSAGASSGCESWVWGVAHDSMPELPNRVGVGVGR